MKVRRLYWEDAGGWLEASTIIGGYIIMPESRELHFHTEEFYHADYFTSKRTMLARGPISELRELANEHYSEQIMSAFRGVGQPEDDGEINWGEDER